jgi:hypothetical protein
MTSTVRRTALTVASLATLALSFAGAAHAQPNGSGSGSGSSSGRGCNAGTDNQMEDGEVRTYKTRHMRGSTTCTDGTRCESWSTQQGDGSWHHFAECYDDPARIVVVVPTTVLAAQGVRPTVTAGQR